MKAMEILMEEHRVIEHVLNTLESSINLLEKGVQIRPEFFLSATDFMRGFADGCHHAKEEGILFYLMQQQGITEDGCPLGVMLAEHECGRQYTRALASAAQAMQAGSPGGNRRAIQSSRSYVALLRQHIMKEDNILFPMAEEIIPVNQHALLMEGFEHVEQVELGPGQHEKFHALATALEQELNNYL
jgi:hemerythrin-like domain-containing protein